ncbi:uncharacterized protein ACB058_014340 [Synchiropus picturatus]
MAHLRLALLLLVAAAFCSQIFQAHEVTGRCLCENTKQYRGAPNVTDFHALDKRPGCDKREMIVWMRQDNNDTTPICLKVNEKMAIKFFACWNRIDKNETRKMECLRRSKPERK